MTLERRVLTLSALLSLNCNAHNQTGLEQQPASYEEQAHGQQQPASQENAHKKIIFPAIVITATPPGIVVPPAYHAEVSLEYVAEETTGVELEIAYQNNLRTQTPGRHIIIVGDYGKPGDGLYIGNVEAVVRTLRSNLRGAVEVWRFPRDVSSGADILEKIENDNGAPINSLHLYGHGDSLEYWLGILPSENSLTMRLLNSLDTETREAIHSKFAPEGYIKFYGCHVAAAENYEADTNISRTTAEVLGITTIGANSWVFIELPEARYMYPVSREHYKYYFTHEKPDYPVPINEHSEIIDDPFYTGESAWVTYIPILRGNTAEHLP